MDYKKMYLEQKLQSLRLEMNLMNMRAAVLEKEMPEIIKELEEYVSKSEEPDKE